MKTIICILTSILAVSALAAYEGWSDPIMIADGDEMTNEYAHPHLALDLEGNYVIVHRRWDGEGDIFFTKIDQAGTVLIEPIPIASTSIWEDRPICVVTTDNTVHVFYIRFDSPYRNVYYVHLNSAGQVIDGPTLFAETHNAGGSGGILPAIIKDRNDIIHLSYCVEIDGDNLLGYTRYNTVTEDRLDVWGLEVTHPNVYDQQLNENYDIAVDSEGSAHLFFDQTLDFNWMNPTIVEVCWAKVPYDSEGEYESKILSRFLVDNFDDQAIRGTIDDDDLIHMIWAGMLDSVQGWIYYSMDTDGNEVTGYQKAFPPPWDTDFFNANTSYNNGNIAVVGTNSDRLVFGRTDLEGEIYEDIDYISDEVIHSPYYDEISFIHHNNSFVGIVWPDDHDLWYQYTLDGFAADDPNLNASCTDDGILLSWQKEGELTGSTWRLERDGDDLVNLSGDALYRYLDRDAEPGITYLYTLEARLPDGSTRHYGPVEAAWPGPDSDRFTLYAPYPCPASDQVILSFHLPEDTQNVELSLYDLSGRLVTSSINLSTAPGRHEIAYDTSAALPSGVYLARLITNTASTTQRLVIAR